MSKSRARKAAPRKKAAARKKKPIAKKQAPKLAAKKPPVKRRPAAKKATGRRSQAPKPAPAAIPDAEAAAPVDSEKSVFGVEVEPGSLENTLEKVRGELGHWVKKGRYTKVRFKFRGKALLPDLPIAAVLAAEAVSFWWAGLLQALLATLGAGALLDVELVNDSAREVARGKDHLLAGELDEAIAAFGRAGEMDRDCAAGYLNLGVAYRLKMDRERTVEYLQRAAAIDPEGPTGAEAQRLLAQIGIKQEPPREQAG